MNEIKEKIKSFFERWRFAKYIFVSVCLSFLLLLFVWPNDASKKWRFEQFYSSGIIGFYWFLFLAFTIIVLSVFCYWQAERSEMKMEWFYNKAKSTDNLSTKNLLEITDSNKNIQNICKSYIKSFLPASIKDKEKTRANADLYFGYVAWIEDIRNGYPVLQALKIIPNTFTGFGILGTFLGFAQGISKINTSGDFEVMKVGIDNLLSGLNTAFNSSIFGVVASILINYIIVLPIVHRLQINSKYLCDYLDERFYISEADAIMQYSVIVDEENNEIPFSMSLKAITESLSNVQSSMDNFTTQLADKLVNMQKQATIDVSNTLQAVLRENVTGQFDVLRENVKSACDILKSCADILKDVPEKLSDTSDKLVESTKISLEEFKRQSETSIKTLNDSITKNLNKKFDSYADSINKSTQTIVQVNKELKTMPSDLHEIIDAISQTKDSMNQSVKELEVYLQNVSRSVKELGNLYETFKASNVLENEKFNNLVEQFDGLYNSYSSVNKECHNMLKEFKSMDSQLERIYKTINSNTEKYSEVVGASLNNYLNSFAEAANEFSAGLSAATNAMNTNLEETKEAADALRESIEKTNKGARK